MNTPLTTSEFAHDILWKVEARRNAPSVPSMPFLDDRAMEFFLEVLDGVDIYLDYGSGGSTVVAAELANHLVSVETDASFARAVRTEVNRRHPSATLDLVHVNIGPTAAWGIPIFKIPTKRRSRLWLQYPRAPWIARPLNTVTPNVVLVDGRFRVASVACSLMGIPEGADTLVLVDDYAVRPEYWVLETVARKVHVAGRMAVFERGEVADEVLDGVRRAFALDWR